MADSKPVPDPKPSAGIRDGNPPPGTVAAKFGVEANPFSRVRSNSRFPLLIVLGVALALLAGIGIGIAFDRVVLPHHTSGAAPGVSDRRNPGVTRETFTKIKPDMSSWEVNDMLGSGEVTAEEGFIIDARGNFKKYSRHAGSYDENTGTLAGHDGKAKQEIKQDVVWRNGSKAIYVTFFNSKVVNKREEGLYRE